MAAPRAATSIISATTRTALPRSALPICSPYFKSRRSFFTNPLAPSGPSTLTATRTVPYPSSTVYSIISDVSSYSSFLPFCTTSIVHTRSSPDAQGRTWPERATLTVGFTAELAESFESRVYCAPERVVEAISGPDAESSLPAEERKHHSPRGSNDPTRAGGVLTSLRTRWELKPLGQRTQVDLKIEYVFSNPLYAIASQAAAPKVADKMIEAFERRIEEVARQRT